MRRSILIVVTFAAAAACAVSALAQGSGQSTDISAQVPSYCRIGGTMNPAALSTTIPVSGLGVVDTTPQVFRVNQVVCNTSTTVVATSVDGGLKSATKSGAAFTNIINYRATARLGTARSTINTGTLKGASSTEVGNAASTSGAVKGNLRITIRPTAPASPLVAGADYQDTLRITLTPD